MIDRSGVVMRRLFASVTAVVSVSAAAVFGGAVGSADDTPTGGSADPNGQGQLGTPGKGYQVGGAKVAGIPYDQYVRATGAKWFPNTEKTIVNYPAGQVQGHTLERLFPGIGAVGEKAYPGIGLDGPSFGESVAVGQENVLAAIRAGGRGTVIGGSEGALVLDAVQARLAVDPNAPAPDQLSFALFGSPIARHAFGQSFITQAFPENEAMASLDYVVPPKVDSQYDTYQFITAYDSIADFPDRPDNWMTIANTIVGLATGHTAVSFTDPSMVPAKNIAMTVNSRGGKEFTYMVPEQHLPLTYAFKLMGVPEETLNRLDAVMKPSVDAGYSRNDNPLTAPITVDPVNGFDPIKVTEEAGGKSLGLLPPPA